MASPEEFAGMRDRVAEVVAEDFDRAMKVLVVGGAGCGKSTMISKHMPGDAHEVPEAGDSCDGVTKGIRIYKGNPLPNGREVYWVDSPGLGDADLKPAAVIASYEMAFNKKYMNGIDAVIVTINLGAGARRDLASQLAEIIIRQGFRNTSNVVLCGTRSDLASARVVDEFQGKLLRNFFKACGNPASHGASAVVHRGDYSKLIRALQAIPAGRQVVYKPPLPTGFGKAIADQLGADRRVMIDQLQHCRAQNASHIEEQKRNIQHSCCGQLASNSLLGAVSGKAACHFAEQHLGMQVAGAMKAAGLGTLKATARFAQKTAVSDIQGLGARAMTQTVKFGTHTYVVGGTAIQNAAATTGAAAGAGLVPGLVGAGVELTVQQLGASTGVSKGCGCLGAVGTGAAFGAAAGPVGAAAGAGTAAALWVGSQLLSYCVINPVFGMG